jgi:hypothetical protein
MELSKKAVVERNGDIGLHRFGIEVKHNGEEIRTVQPLWQRNNYFPVL